ncbi:choline dehydrogenase-like flavoprotein [Pseudonocardia sediminis]|uniref:Choline dehydrogenase-like flavoprotein n=1 Tax=Pseudonocardia sediminis TaxID=1397368 RepID=A0A4Q7URU1_PSEST|nr:GMC family oxidoreductase [Pseudonocardia sediminis]RZT84452.1 choline dehydrogenase-like flavoprotein [Pseudonocardia sediminis]
MIIDARRALPGSSFDAEVCVIGSGPAGATVAAELADRGLRVIVLEGGGTGRDRTADDTYRGVAGEGAHDPVEAVRQKRLGGTSAVWGGRCAPLDDVDFSEREWIPDARWPIAHDELRRYYGRAQRHLDAGECEYSAAASGFPDPSPEVTETDALRWDDLWRWSPPTTFAPRMRTLAQTGRIRLFTHATVTRLDRDPVGGAATEAVVVPRRGQEVRVRAREFVLAAGGLESTRILLASDGYGGSGLGAGIGNAHDQVGRHYMTHPVGEVGRLRLTPAGQALGLGYAVTPEGVYARRMLSLAPSVQAEQGLGNLKAAVWFADPKDPSHRDALLSTFALTYWGMGRVRAGFKAAGTHAQYTSTTGISRHLRNVVGDPRRVARFARGWARPRLTGERHLPSFMPLDSSHCRLRFDAEQTPSATNRVTLDRERDALGQCRLRIDYSVSASDRQSIATSLTLIGKELERTGLATVDLSDVERVGDLPMTDGTHQMGLLRMADSPREGVVDARCRVHGTPNVHVASSAVFPSSGAVGPTLALVAMACRTADGIS